MSLDARCGPRKACAASAGSRPRPRAGASPACLPFSSTATGTSPSRSASSGASSSSCPSRIAHARPAGPAPTIRTPTSIRSSGGSVGCDDELARVERRRIVRRARRRALRCPDELGQLRDDLVQVADDPEIGELEDRRVRVLVDRDDRARALHPDLVLDRAGDADGDVELRRDGLARLADLRRVRVPARVDDGARCGNGAAERLRELLDELEVLRAAEAAAAGDDHVRVLDRRAPRSPRAPARPSSPRSRSPAARPTRPRPRPRRRSPADRRRRSGRARAAARPSSRRPRTTESPSAGRLPTS